MLVLYLHSIPALPGSQGMIHLLLIQCCRSTGTIVHTAWSNVFYNAVAVWYYECPHLKVAYPKRFVDDAAHLNV